MEKPGFLMAYGAGTRPITQVGPVSLESPGFRKCSRSCMVSFFETQFIKCSSLKYCYLFLLCLYVMWVAGGRLALQNWLFVSYVVLHLVYPCMYLYLYLCVIGNGKGQNNCHLQVTQVIQMLGPWFTCKSIYLDSIYKDLLPDYYQFTC